MQAVFVALQHFRQGILENVRVMARRNVKMRANYLNHFVLSLVWVAPAFQ